MPDISILFFRMCLFFRFNNRLKFIWGFVLIMFYVVLLHTKQLSVEFTELNRDTDCDCIKGTIEDLESLYSRAIKQHPTTDLDFQSYWEKKHRAIACEDICRLKGISVSKIHETSDRDNIIKLYGELFPTSPKYKKSVMFFRFKKNAGQVKHSPSDRDKNHHTFYKADEFQVQLVEAIEIIDLAHLQNNKNV
jgi:hypothetical protein